jgi:type I restriction enzyme S subunit
MIANMKIPVPPLPEQRAIAAVLSDVDALIAALDALIEKKRLIKQGAMQELLTGKRRLPGFSEDWEIKTFGELVVLRKQKFDPRKIEEPLFCVELEHIEQNGGKLIGYTTTSNTSSIKSVFHEGDVLFGKLRAYLRKYWLADRDGVCTTEIWPLVSMPEKITGKFLFQLVQLDSFIEIASMAYGTHMPRTDWNLIKNYSLHIPPLKEQQNIAEILSEMDAEIAALENSCQKTLQLKQGMMQELLTGRIRLV